MKARKRFGQNFLQDQNVIRGIIKAIAPKPSDTVLEIGPGHGALTRHLLDSGCNLTVVEIDRDLVASLRNTYSTTNLAILSEDIMAFDFTTLSHPTRVVGNLPYNISTPLLYRMFEFREQFSDMTFMLQAEVVERMIAQPGNGRYGRLGIMCQYFCETEKLLDVPPTAFVPAPKVDSAVVSLRPHRHIENPIHNLNTMTELLTTAFSKRRKTMRNAVRGLLTGEQRVQLDIDPTDRPETIVMAAWIRAANKIASGLP